MGICVDFILIFLVVSAAMSKTTAAEIGKEIKRSPDERIANINRLASLETRRQRPRRKREKSKEAADIANHVFRSIVGEAVHDGKRRQRREPRPPEVFSDQARRPHSEVAERSVKNPSMSKDGFDLETLTSKQAARDHVEKTLGHHRRRRRHWRNSNTELR